MSLREYHDILSTRLGPAAAEVVLGARTPTVAPTIPNASPTPAEEAQTCLDGQDGGQRQEPPGTPAFARKGWMVSLVGAAVIVVVAILAGWVHERGAETRRMHEMQHAQHLAEMRRMHEMQHAQRLAEIEAERASKQDELDLAAKKHEAEMKQKEAEMKQKERLAEIEAEKAIKQSELEMAEKDEARKADIKRKDEDRIRQEQQMEKLQVERSLILAEPEVQLRADAVAITKNAPDMSVLDKLQTESLQVYAQVAISQCAKADLGAAVKLHLSSLPIQVSEHIAKVAGTTQKKTIYADRKFESEDGVGYYFDVKMMVNITDDGQASFAARASGTTFKVKQAVIDYKEEKIPIMGTKKIRGQLQKKADCGIKTQSGTQCQFPFTYDGISFKDCTNHWNRNYKWCATARRGEEMASWDYCTKRQYFDDCDVNSEKYGAIFEMVEEKYTIDYEKKMHPVFDRSILPAGVSQDEVMDALVYRSAKQLL